MDLDDDIENNEELDNVLVLNDEEGKEVKFEFLDLIEYNNEKYIILLPVDRNDDDDDVGEVVILKIEETKSDEEESYVSVDNEETLNKVFEIFKEKFKEEFNFIEE